jgi:hypothetical protein
VSDVAHQAAKVAAVLGFASGAFAMSPTAVASTAIGPNQSFVGLVNGHASKATIDVVCPGPARLGQTGHPAGGQTIGVQFPPPSTVPVVPTGYTGTRGRSIVASFISPVAAQASPASSTVVFSQYGTVSLPTTLLVPCIGSGSVLFTPKPTSKTARSATVSVSYVNLAVAPTPANIHSSASRTITITQADSGHKYRIHIGDSVDVRLSTTTGSIIWSEPSSSNQEILQRTGGSAGTTATATFEAKARGTAQVGALGAPNCSTFCPLFIILFEVTVTVVS